MRKHIIIIGGGITGLAAAYRLQRSARARGLPLVITLLEGDAQLGGKLRTVRDGEFIIETGPDSFLASKPQALALCAELGLGERLIGTNAAQRRTFIYSKGRLHDLPAGFSGLVPGRIGPLLRSALISPRGKARLLLDLLLPARGMPPVSRSAVQGTGSPLPARGMPPVSSGAVQGMGSAVPARPAGGDESVAAFMRRRLGREAFDRLIEPLMSGIYAGDSDQLSLAATFPQLRQMELERGGLLRGVMGQKDKSLAQLRPVHRTSEVRRTPVLRRSVVVDRRRKGAKKSGEGTAANGQLRANSVTKGDHSTAGEQSRSDAVENGQGITATGQSRGVVDESGAGKRSAIAAAPQATKWTGFVSLRGGMGEMVEALERQLDIDVRTGQRVESLARGEHGWLVRVAGETMQADAVIVTTPAYASAELLQPLDVRLAELHRAIPHGSTATITLAYRQTVAAPAPGGEQSLAAGSDARASRDTSRPGSEQALPAGSGARASGDTSRPGGEQALPAGAAARVSRDTSRPGGENALAAGAAAQASGDQSRPGGEQTLAAGSAAQGARDTSRRGGGAAQSAANAAGDGISAPVGFGFVVPSIEQRPLLACTFVSNKFAGRAPAGVVLIRCFIGRVGGEALLAQDDAALVALARSELKAILGIDAQPLWAKVFRWERGMPQYNLGHLERVADIEALLAAQPGLFAAGAAYHGVGIPDCIRSGEDAAAQALEFLDKASAR